MIGALLAIILINIIFRNKAGTPHTLNFNWDPYIKQGSIYVNDIHIHHWLSCFTLLVFLIPFQMTSTSPLLLITNGLLFILMLQGLLYEDRFDF